MTDTNYEARIADETGRGIVQGEVTCRDCGGHGFNAWEECQTCDGHGWYVDYFFDDVICQHEVAMCDCKFEHQDGPKGFVVTVDPETVEWMGRDEFMAFERARLQGVRALHSVQVGLVQALSAGRAA